MFLIIIFTAAVISLARRDSAFWIIAWPGTVIHELLHLLIGWIINGKPTELSVIPTPWPGGYALGYVDFANITWYNSTPIALAPLLSVPVVYWLSLYVPVTWTWGTALAVWALASAVAQCMPSSQDMSLIRRHPWGLIFWTAIGYAVYKSYAFFG